MKVEKFKVLLYLKKSEPDKSGKAPIMGRITVNRSMVEKPGLIDPGKQSALDPRE